MEEQDNKCRFYSALCTGIKTPELHPCPYQQEINDNDEDYCDCCEECEQECREDI